MEIIFSMYSVGYPISDIKQIYPKLVEQVFRSSLSKIDADYSFNDSEPYYGTDEYWEILQILALGILLDADEDSHSKILYIRDKVPTPDIVLDMLSSFFDGREVSAHQLRGNKYNGLVNLILKQTSENIPQLMSDYLKKQWMKDYKRQGFLTTHDSNLHVGYWSFESGAIMKILKADDTILKGQQFYPYDMVHWQ